MLPIPGIQRSEAASRGCGRFAPSPTGPLHFGSLVTALASWLDARARRQRWLVRIEDLDRPRTVAGAEGRILRTLERFGLLWDGRLLRQSTRDPAYRDALERLREGGWIYPCACSRREIRELAHAGIEGPVYPGTCRRGLPPGRQARAWRLRIPEDGRIRFTDRLHGPQEQDLHRDVGDFVVLRADGLFAYQLAVVVDDAYQGVTSVVRGADLLASTPRQILLQRLMDLPTPEYLHVPVVTTPQGDKFAKQHQAAPLDEAPVVPTLVRALRFLGQHVPEGAGDAQAPELLQHALDHWDPGAIPRRRAIPVDAPLP
ncbi:MAG: tRNA glutamyl-Q(34) synthetase GluQRS [Gammaproteobacteria bacterium]|nr:MAG: tRNA glutamyl-Q(34) synthetase GluQRS [Gammaproteobacteria bacterium]